MNEKQMIVFLKWYNNLLGKGWRIDKESAQLGWEAALKMKEG